MHGFRPSVTLLAGIAGIVLGWLAEVAVNRYAGRPVIADGMLWGAVVAIVAASVPRLTRMGSLAVRSDKPVINLLAGTVLFVLISTVVVIFFYAVFSVLGWLLK